MYFDKSNVKKYYVKKNVNIFLLICLIISYVIKKFDFTFE